MNQIHILPWTRPHSNGSIQSILCICLHVNVPADLWFFIVSHGIEKNVFSPSPSIEVFLTVPHWTTVTAVYLKDELWELEANR